jgi:hypothetical protein
MDAIKCFPKQKTDAGQTLIGQKFGDSLVVRQEKNKDGKRVWVLSCGLCGKEYESSTSELNKGRKRTCGCNRNKVAIGYKYNHLTPISKNKNVYECICDCGKITHVFSNNLLRGHTKSCGCIRFSKDYSHHSISSRFFTQVKRSAKQRNLDFDITPDDLWDIYCCQNKKCYYTDLDIIFAKTWQEYESGIQTCSIDRKDNSIGYIRSNIQIVHKIVNIMRGQLSEQDFIILCSRVYAKHGKI